ncbi:hypothetical protein ABZX88_33620 [Kitasatospora aureofaciens]|uniref:hypothetical protein n=1 Tax=Kitasatospora aureofaciens TaxID=1894 RepID=UPI0033BD7E56
MTTDQTTDLRTRTLRAVVDTADSAATVAAGAAVGLTAYRALTARTAETRITLALAAGTLAAILTDQTSHRVLTPLRRRLGIERFPVAPRPVASKEQIAADAIANAAGRAAAGAIHLDFSSGALTKPENWVGSADGSATCELTPTARLLYNPSGSDAGTAEYKGRPRYYELIAEGEAPTVVTTVTQLAQLLERLADGSPLDDDEYDPWEGADDGADPIDHKDLDYDDEPEDEDDQNGMVLTGYSEEPPF